MLYRITIKRGAATITSLSLQTDDAEQAAKLARLDFDLQRRRRGATSVILTDQNGTVVYSYSQSETAVGERVCWRPVNLCGASFYGFSRREVR